MHIIFSTKEKFLKIKKIKSSASRKRNFSHLVASTAAKQRNTYQFSAKHSQFNGQGEMIFPSPAQQFTWQHLFFDSFPFITSIRLKGRQWRHLDALRQDFPCFSPFPSHTTTRYGSQNGATENVEGTLHIFFLNYGRLLFQV